MAALAQDDARPSTARPVFGSGLELVNVTIIVRDEQGPPGARPGPDDFTVYEDGRPQKPLVFGSPAALGGEQPLDDDNYASTSACSSTRARAC